jgi:poly(A) polymerase
MPTLPDASWRHRSGLAALIAALNGEPNTFRYVGGVVRDTLIGLEPHDIDFATRLPPEEVMARLKAAGIKAIPTGLAHGTITAVSEGHPYEITTLRRDVSTDGRRATIIYTDDWREDAARRDFTINALSADPDTGTLYDYFGGLDDLAAGRVRFIGDALTRIAEDHLRILRYFRFHARFGRGAPDPAALAACAARANDLMALSRERIADELMKILALPDPAPIITLMIAHGIFKPVLPEIVSANALAELIIWEKHEGIAPAPLRHLAALLSADPKLAENIANRLKFSNAQRKRLICLAERNLHDTDHPRGLAYTIGLENARDRLLLCGFTIASLVDWQSPIFPLTGGALIAQGLKPGPQVAAALKAIEAQWVALGFPNEGILQGLIADELKRCQHVS